MQLPMNVWKECKYIFPQQWCKFSMLQILWRHLPACARHGELPSRPDEAQLQASVASDRCYKPSRAALSPSAP